MAHFYLAAALALLGSLKEAKAAVQAGLALDPSFTIGRLRAQVAVSSAVTPNPERVLEAMRVAGAPEG